MNAIAEVPAISLPEILTANCYFWNSGGSADQRRRNESNRINQVVNFFKQKGFEVTQSGHCVNAKGFGLDVCFSYSESCKNVYKTLSVYRNGKKSNVTAIRKTLKIS